MVSTSTIEEKETQQLRRSFFGSFLRAHATTAQYIHSLISQLQAPYEVIYLLVRNTTDVAQGGRCAWYGVISMSKSPTRGLEYAVANDASGAVEDSRLAPIGFEGEDDVQLFWWIFSLARKGR